MTRRFIILVKRSVDENSALRFFKVRLGVLGLRILLPSVTNKVKFHPRRKIFTLKNKWSLTEVNFLVICSFNSH